MPDLGNPIRRAHVIAPLAIWRTRTHADPICTTRCETQLSVNVESHMVCARRQSGHLGRLEKEEVVPVFAVQVPKGTTALID